jgi:hypothetical protein
MKVLKIEFTGHHPLRKGRMFAEIAAKIMRQNRARFSGPHQAGAAAGTIATGGRRMSHTIPAATRHIEPAKKNAGR